MVNREQLYRDERIELHGRSFHNCTFEDCELIFDGDRPPTLKDNQFKNSIFVFTGAATRTLYLLSNIYHAGGGGKEVVEQTFANIRDRTMQGHEIRTIAPHTVDHSFD